MRNFFLNNVLVYKALLIKGKGCKKGAYGLIYSGGVVAQMGDKVQRWGRGVQSVRTQCDPPFLLTG